MTQEDKSIRSNSCPGRPTGFSTAPAQVPTGYGLAASTRLEQNPHENDETLRTAVDQDIVGIAQADMAVRTSLLQHPGIISL